MNKFKLCFHPDTDSRFSNYFNKTFETKKEAETALNVIADFTLFLHKENFMPDHSNAAYLGELIDGEWKDVEQD